MVDIHDLERLLKDMVQKSSDAREIFQKLFTLTEIRHSAFQILLDIRQAISQANREVETMADTCEPVFGPGCKIQYDQRMKEIAQLLNKLEVMLRI